MILVWRGGDGVEAVEARLETAPLGESAWSTLEKVHSDGDAMVEMVLDLGVDGSWGCRYVQKR